MQPPQMSDGGSGNREMEGQQNHHHHHHHHHSNSPSYETEAAPPHDDFLEQMLSTLPNCSWPDLSNTSSSTNPNHHHHHHPSLKPLQGAAADGVESDDPYPSSSALDNDTTINNNNNNAGSVKSFLLHQQLLLSRGGSDSGGLIPLPLSLAHHGAADSVDSRLLLDPHHHPSQHDILAASDAPSSFKSPSPQGGDGSSVQALFNSFAGPLHGNGQAGNQQQPLIQAAGGGGGMPVTNFAMNQPPGNGATSGGGDSAAAGAAAPPQRQRVRARRGQATDPHSIAERLRRERIAERMKALQELVPNANKTDKASMLDEIIDYVKFLQLQVKVLSMSRLGGAAAVAPLVADLSSEAGGGGRGSTSTVGGLGGSQLSDREGNNNSSSMEHQVAKLMEEDMGSAMQYLQGKGLCLMPISLASAISTATCHSNNNNTAATRPTHSIHNAQHQNQNPSIHHHQRRHPNSNNVDNGDGPSSPSLSALTVQSSSLLGNGSAATAPVKDPKS